VNEYGNKEHLTYICSQTLVFPLNIYVTKKTIT